MTVTHPGPGALIRSAESLWVDSTNWQAAGWESVKTCRSSEPRTTSRSPVWTMDRIGVSFLDPLDDYELIHRIGSGTYGDVFKVSESVIWTPTTSYELMNKQTNCQRYFISCLLLRWCQWQLLSAAAWLSFPHLYFWKRNVLSFISAVPSSVWGRKLSKPRLAEVEQFISGTRCLIDNDCSKFIIKRVTSHLTHFLFFFFVANESFNIVLRALWNHF